MRSVEQFLVSGIGRDSVTLHETFQGLPGMAHGGSVLAVFDAIASPHGPAAPREIFGSYRRKVPLNAPLAIEVRRLDTRAECRLWDRDQLLVEGVVSPPGASRESLEQPALPENVTGGYPLPVSNDCFACGVKNPLGLQVTLRFDERRVWTEYLPRDSFRSSDRHLSTAALTTLLDEAAFWLGVLTTGESGMTTELRVTLHQAAVRFGDPLIVIGERERVMARSDDPRYRATETAILARDGARLATGRITFVAMRGAARRLVERMLRINSPEIVRRVFPNHAD